MKSTKEFRLVNANEKLEAFEIKSFREQFEKLEKQVKPKDYQCMIIGDIVVFKCTYNLDTIITIKTPRKKAVIEIGNYSEQFQKIIEKINKKHNFNKKQSNEALKNITNAYDDIKMDLEKLTELYYAESTKIKNRDDKRKQIDEFYNSYDKFNECLTSQISEFDSEIKDDIKTKLNNLVQLVEEDIIKKYLK